MTVQHTERVQKVLFLASEEAGHMGTALDLVRLVEVYEKAAPGSSGSLDGMGAVLDHIYAVLGEPAAPAPPQEPQTRVIMQEVYEGYLSYVVECLKDIAQFTPYPHVLLHFDEWKARTANIGQGGDGKSDGS